MNIAKECWAGVVIYKPNFSRFVKNIKSISAQFNGIICYNNGCNSEVLSFLSSLSDNVNIVVIGDGNNVGIATALNKIMNYAKESGLKWVATMDQDSVLPLTYLEEITNKNIREDVAIICPKVVDKRRISMIDSNNLPTEQFVDKCITSASFTRIEAWDFVGGFDDFLFIDLVDNDFCKRLIIAGWKILKINNIVLDQEFGNIKLKGEKTVSILLSICNRIKNKKLAENIMKLSYKKTVSPMRIYYSNRNILYLNKKLKKYGGIGYESYNCKTYFGYALFYNIASIIRSEDKCKVIKSIFLGIRDGILVKVKPININHI